MSRSVLFFFVETMGSRVSLFHLNYRQIGRDLRSWVEILIVYFFKLRGAKVIKFSLAVFCRLEEKQRDEKRNREAKGHQFTPKWFDLTSEINPTPWGDLEVYSYNGKYAEHRAAVDSLDSVEEVDITSTNFNPWQYENSAPE